MNRRVFIILSLLLAGWLAWPAAGDEPAKYDASRWEKEIASLEALDKQSPPAKGGVLFVGSSSIRLWDLKKHFPDLNATNHGFGGSQIVDSTYFADRLVFACQPKTVVLYAGDNDIASGKSPEQVIDDFKKFAAVIHEKLPETRILYISIKPSAARWKLIDKIRAANAGIEEMTRGDKRFGFIDVHPPMLGDDGMPRKELLLDDGLHLSAAGYEIWTKLVQAKVGAGEQ
jgi:lysophospholipase L1-like esterase